MIDFDGTIADTLGYLRLVYARFVREHGGEPSEAEFQSLNGPPIAEVVRRLCETYAIPQPVPDRVARYNFMIDEDFATSTVMPGAREMMTAAAEAGILNRIVTSNAQPRVDRWLAANGLDAICQVLVSSEDGVEGKPSPAPYLLGLKKLELTAAEAVAIEDSTSGARSALAAGLTTIKLAPALPAEPGLYVVDTLDQAAALIAQGFAQ